MTNKTAAISSEKNFYLFFCSTVLSIIGMDIYLFTHGWFLVALGASKQSIGVSWAIFFLPSLVMLPLCGKLLAERPVRSILLSFEIAKALLLWAAFALFRGNPDQWMVYGVSALLGLCFSPFYPATYTLLRELFADQRVVRYSNAFEVSLQLAGALALVGSGFVLEKFGFIGIVFIAAITISASCIFLYLMWPISKGTEIVVESWGNAFKKTFLLQDRSEVRRPQFFLGIIHQIPQTCILLSNIPLILYVTHVMNAGPREYGFLDGFYGVVALITSLLWAKWAGLSSNRRLLVGLSVLGALAFAQFAALPGPSPLPYLYMTLFALTMTSAKIMSRATLLQTCDKVFIAKYTPFFQVIANISLVAGAFIVGALMDWHGVRFAMAALMGLMLLYSFLVSATFLKIKK